MKPTRLPGSIVALLSVFALGVLSLSAQTADKPGKSQKRRESDLAAIIGLQLKAGQKFPSIEAVLEGSPAGTNSLVRPGMLLLAMADGGKSGTFVSTGDLPLEKVQGLLRGRAGTTVALKISKPSADPFSGAMVVEVQRVLLEDCESDDGVARWLGPTTFDYKSMSNISNVVGPLERVQSVWSATDKPIQPSYDRWLKIKPGMTEGDVKNLLGDPLRIKGQGQGVIHIWDYGFVALTGPVMPEDLTFSIYFDGGKVMLVEDPFHGNFSTNGLPVKPSLITPHDQASFDHYPRILDLRWNPVSGDYPMEWPLVKP